MTLHAVKRKPDHQPVSPERTALADAVAELREVTDTIRAAEDAVAPTRAHEHGASRAVDEATAALDAARTAGAEHVARTAMGQTSEPPALSAREARAALDHAQDNLAMARGACEALKRVLSEANSQLGFAEQRVTNAAAAVVRTEAEPAITALSAEVTRLQAELVSKGALLAWFARERMMPLVTETGLRFGKPLHEPTLEALARLDFAPSQWVKPSHQVVPLQPMPIPALQPADAAAPWQAALQALRTDAGAVLPVQTYANGATP